MGEMPWKGRWTHTHTLVHTQKDSTVYKMCVTNRFKLVIQVSEKALWHRKGMRPKENLAMAFCGEGPHQALYSEQ